MNDHIPGVKPNRPARAGSPIPKGRQRWRALPERRVTGGRAPDRGDRRLDALDADLRTDGWRFDVGLRTDGWRSMPQAAGAPGIASCARLVREDSSARSGQELASSSADLD
ncbi:hypothetical protein [Sorangium sp. So ce204]|uniref:hypothetical protein n=1 Tax=Sorangium sp. So ce204 TaxID=3133288 RepID=UPI003F648D96